MDDVEELILGIRKRVLEEAQKKFADETFQQLRYSLFNGRLSEPDGVASLAGDSGECMEMYLKFKNDRVQKASYLSDGDRATCLFGSYAAELAIGRNCSELLQITALDLIKRADMRGAGLEKWALLAVTALHKAAENYWLQRGGGTTVRKVPLRPRFVAVGAGRHMQYSN